MSRWIRVWCSVIACVTNCAICAELRPQKDFSVSGGPLRIVRAAVPRKPFTVAGPSGAILGRQSGVFEAWLWPVKVLSNFRIRAELAEYPVPIDVNALAAEISVTPAETIISYSHAAFTVRQHMFAARTDSPVIGAAVYFEISSVRPMELTFSFTPEMLRMWPAPNFGRPNGEWVAEGQAGFYVLHTDDSAFAALIAMPRTRSGVLPPYQERPQTYPLELRLSFDPKRDAGLVFPLVMAIRNKQSPSDQAGAAQNAVPHVYAEAHRYYEHFFDSRLTAETPDRRLDDALRWAEIAIDQAAVRHGNETGLIAGYYESGDSARPGYAWFFGRDTLWTSYAINSYGDFELTRTALDFLIRRQRADGKIMHEYSQAADLVDWKTTPYFYASADSTPLFVMAMNDYVAASGDFEYLRKNWAAVRKAYDFTRQHDSDGDGIYDNSEGTGWVESWPPAMPKQEIYLAALDQQSAAAMARLATFVKDNALAASAGKVAETIRNKLEPEYYDPGTRFWAFSRNPDGSRDNTASIYPAVAWWNGTLALGQAGNMFSRWATHEFSTDWGTRDISGRTPFYDPISYHQGSVWPLFTGWVSLAEYRSGRTLSGFAHLMQNAGLTWTQDLGSVTELLSGEFFQPLGRSSSHQTWSSAMVLSPAVRGLFGLECDAPTRTLRLEPHLPATWERATLRNVMLGKTPVELEYERRGARLQVRAATNRPEVLCLAGRNAQRRECSDTAATVRTIELDLPPVEVEIPHGLPVEGSPTEQLKVVDEPVGANQASFAFEARGGSVYELPVRLNRLNVRAQNAELTGRTLRVRFPQGPGYQTVTVVFTW